MNDPVVFLDGRRIPLSQARISPEDRGFLFGDGVYESIRYYPSTGSGDGVFFELERHADRLRASLAAIRLDGVDLAPVLDALPQLIDENGLRDAHASIYVQVTRGVAPRTHAFPGRETPPTVYARARRFTLLTDAWREGVAVVTVDDVRWGRCDVKSIALLANVLASEDAKSRGGFEAVFVRDGIVTEGSRTAVAFVGDGVVRIHPSGSQILPSVTREVVLDLARAQGIQVEERAVGVAELGAIDEMFLLGTTTELMPVISLDGQPVGAGTVGPITRRLQDAYFALHP